MDEDLRCCGTGTCLINAEGVCWCGQRWDGEKMCFAESKNQVETAGAEATPAGLPPTIDQPARC